MHLRRSPLLYKLGRDIQQLLGALFLECPRIIPLIRHISRRGADGNVVSFASLPLTTYSHKYGHSRALGNILYQFRAILILSHALYNVYVKILAWVYVNKYYRVLYLVNVKYYILLIERVWHIKVKKLY